MKQLLDTTSPGRNPWRFPLFLLLAFLALAPWTQDVLAKTPDVRILVDVSGSMRKTDPKNLRIPALQLVNELLPAGARSGVWMFAENTEELAPPETVDDRWKGKTRLRLKRIHSRGLFTDIEKAIATATVGWESPDENHERHLVLLTDGLVDVSKKAEESAASRQRILSTQLEQLKKAGAKVHTIGLSDQVDKELLKLLSSQTDGWFETARNADALQRAFLHMLEQSAAPTTVPLQGNRFDIDAQVSEFTLLAFHEVDKRTKLISPSGKEISADQPPPGVIWRAELGYDLITISTPESGTWRLEGISDPDNRVAVITDLGIDVGKLPNRVLAGEAVPVETWLTDHGQPITRPDLLELLSAQVVRNSTQADTPPGSGQAVAKDKGEARKVEEGTPAPPSTEHETKAAPSPTQSNLIDMTLDPDSGHFTASVDTSNLQPGTYQLEFVIDGGTFKRQMIRHLKVSGPPISVKFEQRFPSEQLPAHAIDVIIDAEGDLVDPQSLAGYLLLKAPKDKESVLELSPPKKLPTGIRFPVLEPGEYEISSKVFARTVAGKAISFTPEPAQFTFEFEAPPSPEEEKSGGDSDFSWLTLVLTLVGGNVFLALLIIPTLWYLKRPKQQTPKASKGTVKKATKSKKRKAK